MEAAASFSGSGAALVTTLRSEGLVRVLSARDLTERFRYVLPGAYLAALCGDSSLLAVAATHGTRHRIVLINAARARGTVLAEVAVSERVHRILMSPTRLVIVSSKACDVLDLATRRPLVTFSTPDNPLGVAALAVAPPRALPRGAEDPAAPLADLAARSAACHLLLPASSTSGELAVYDLRSLEVVGVLAAHEAPVTCAVASPDGRLVATASARGTIVRVHTVPDGARIASFRRGSRPAALRSLAWLSQPAALGRPASVGDAPLVIAAASDSATVHVFAKGLRRPSASAAMAEAAGGFLSSVAGIFTGRPAATAAAAAAPRRPSGTPPRPHEATSAPSALPAPELADRAAPSSRASDASVSSTSTRGDRRQDGPRAGPASLGAAMSEAVQTGLRMGGVEGDRSFATLRRGGVDGREAPAVAAMAVRWVSADDWACGIAPADDGAPLLEGVVVLASGGVLRYRVDGVAGGEGVLVGEGRITTEGEDDERGVRGGAAGVPGLGLAMAVAPPPPSADDVPAAASAVARGGPETVRRASVESATTGAAGSGAGEDV